MQIQGFAKTTLLDYPGHLASTIFLGHCNFRCPFCHNKDLVLMEKTLPGLSKEELITSLKKRSSIIEGVCITGGEPTLEKELKSLLYAIKELGLLIKLDTNGYQPQVLEDLYSEALLDYVAMDIKSSPDGYAKAAGLSFIDLGKINASIALLRESGQDYEFRTTLVRELHTMDTMLSIKNWLFGSRAYYLQPYKESSSVLLPGFTTPSLEELKSYQSALQDGFAIVEIRGID